MTIIVVEKLTIDRYLLPDVRCVVRRGNGKNEREIEYKQIVKERDKD